LSAFSRRTPGTLILALLATLSLAFGTLLPATTAQAQTLPRGVVLAKAAAPTLASVASTALALDWADFPGAGAYRVRYSKYASLKKSSYKRVSSSGIALSKLKANTKYYVRVQAIKADAKGTPLSAYSATKSFRTAKKPKYAAPTGMRAQASARGADTIAANWSFTTAGRSYEVQYGTSARFVGASSQVSRAASVAIGGLKADTTYYLRVRIVYYSGGPASDWSKAVSATTKTPADRGAVALNVASFNVRNGLIDPGAGQPWSVRRTLVAGSILAQQIDVAGLQEAEYSYLPNGEHQYQDLLDLLGPSWKITCGTDDNPYCDHMSNYSAGTRIVYNSEKVSLERSGLAQLTTSAGDTTRRFVVWAVFVQKATERRFFFADTHLVNNKDGGTYNAKTKKCSAGGDTWFQLRKLQATQVMATINANNTEGLPVLLTGDMNSHRWRCPGNAPYQVYAGAGLVDPLGNPDFSTVPIRPTTEVRIHSEFDTPNLYLSKPVIHNTINGHHVDYVWVSKQITTLDYEIVVNINNLTLSYVGTHPSDHNMVRATVLIPAR
jgi:endonuclease/exonuclease/phosphatase family metal-dependent hydrolase